MAKAKKKLNTNLVAVAAIVVAGLLVAGAGGGYMVYRSKRPDQLKTEGRELMLKGDYAEAFKRFSRAGSRKSTDPEFLTWMQETETHLTSFDPMHYHASYGLLSAIITASSDKVPPTLKKVEADLVKIRSYSPDQINLDIGRDFDSSAKVVLDRDPKNVEANRVRAYVKVLPLFQPGATPTSTEVQTIVEDMKVMNEQLPDDPEVAYRYVTALIKHREALIREGSVTDSLTSDNVKMLGSELKRLTDHMLEIGRNESAPAEDRSRSYGRTFDLMQMMVTLQILPTTDEGKKTFGDNMVEAITKSSELVPATSDYLLEARAKYALNFLAPQKRYEQAEKVMRDTIDQLPKQWRPRVMLANMLSDADRPQDALALLDVEKNPDYDLVGIDGYIFDDDSRRVPLQRALFRLQAITKLNPEARDAEVAKIEADYKTATSKKGAGENDVYALQIQAGLQKLQQNRTGALKTIEKALQVLSGSAEQRQLRFKLLGESLDLNISLGQSGRAEEIARQMLQLQPGNVPMRLQLIDLMIRNGKKSEAEKMLKDARDVMPDNPALAALAIRLLPDEASKLAELNKIPETAPTPERTLQLIEIKMQIASSVGLEKVAGEIAERYLKDNPDHYRVTLMYVQSLLKQSRNEEALNRINALLVKNPNDPNLLIAKDIVVAADNPEKLQKIMDDKASERSPVAKILIEAQKLLPGDPDGYLKKMYEAEAIDTTGGVTERIYYYLLNATKYDEAEKSLDKLAKTGRDPAEIRTNRMRIGLGRAGLLAGDGKVEEANRLFDKTADEANAMVVEMPQFSGAYIIKALALNARGKLQESYDAFQSALVQQPGNMEALRYAIELAQALGRGDDMKKLIEAGKRLAPADPYFAEALLRYEVAFGDPQKAIEPRIRQRDEAIENPNTWLVLGQTYLAAAKKATDDKVVADLNQKAISTFKQAGEKFADAPGFGLAAASVMNGSGDAEGAAKIVTDLVANEKNLENTTFLAALANYYIETVQNDKALDVMQKLIAKGTSNSVLLRNKMARLYADSGRVDEALATLDSVPETAETREMRINLLLSARKVEEANKLANEYLTKEKTVSSLLMAAHTEGVTNNVARSIDLANQAVMMDSNNANTHLYKAKMMMRERPMRNSEILELLQTAKKLAPENTEARMLLSDRLAAIGRVDESVLELESVVADLPGNRDMAIRLIKAYMGQRPMPDARIGPVFERLRKDKLANAEVLTLETNWSLIRKDTSSAVRSAKAALETDPENVALYRQLIDAMVADKKLRDVLSELDRVQVKNPNVYWTYLIRGTVLHSLKRETDAAKEWDKALSMVMSLKDDSPTGEVVEKYAAAYGSEATGKWLNERLGQDARMRALMLVLYSNEKQYAKAIEMGNSLKLEMDKLNTRTQVLVYNSLGNAYLMGSPSDPTKARMVFEDLVKIDKDSPLSLNNLAYAMMLEGADLPAAAKIAAQAYDLTVKSGSPNAYIGDTYGWALVQAGKVTEGIEALRDAAAVEEIPDIAYHLGEAFILQGQKDAAQQSLQNALALIQSAVKNGRSVDSGLEPRVRDAISRANAMAVQ